MRDETAVVSAPALSSNASPGAELPDRVAGEPQFSRLRARRLPVRYDGAVGIEHVVFVAVLLDGVALLGRFTPGRAIAVVGDAPGADLPLLLALGQRLGGAVGTEGQGQRRSARRFRGEALAGAEGLLDVVRRQLVGCLGRQKHSELQRAGGYQCRSDESHGRSP